MSNNLIWRISRPISSGIFSGLPYIGKKAVSWSSKRFFHSDPQLWTKEDHPKIIFSMQYLSCYFGQEEFTMNEDHFKEIYDELEPPSEREEDMLDMAPQVCETSRLACQIKVDEKLTKGNIRLPNITRNFYVDGFKPSPH
ncbi:ferredoxin-like protein FD1 [Cryptosporidium ubiquitum]|uniref:Ferredoxin-like protein FD1 n=1 Tax=Cryptosporidium ubiquitum TaxID=857276 RepID=A0A1J4MJK6_9CRYT|nr:ferredoxin-like protein FD1 [Cryptosporidium ubiquitum]OII73196.1 ferredoxin-like protein FD1 [Cryptosporidium ubiquitum]